MAQLPEPSFIERDANTVTSELVAYYEGLTGKTLQPAQPEMLLINLVAYRETLLRIAVQEAAKQNLVSYAIFPMLDYLGELVGCTRLAAACARCTLRFTLVAAQSFDVLVAAGTRVESKDGKVIFTSEFNVTIPAGQISGDISAVAESSGIAGNGYLPGEINTLLQTVAYVQSAANTVTTSGGTDEESDDNYRERIKAAPEGFSNAGSQGAYTYWTKSAHPDVIDVAVTSPSDGVVNVYPLTRYGNPDAAMIAVVSAALSDDKVRPLTDKLNVLAPTRIDFSLEAAVTVFVWADSPTVKSDVETTLADYVAGLRVKLGADIIPSQINSVYGAYKTVITFKDSNGAVFAERVLAKNEWANCTSLSVTVTGVNNG